MQKITANSMGPIRLASSLIITFPFIEKVFAACPIDGNPSNEITLIIYISVRKPFYSAGRWKELIEKATPKMLPIQLENKYKITYQYVLNYNYN